MTESDSSIQIDVITGQQSALALKTLTYQGIIDGAIARFSLQQHFTNLSSRAQEIVYTFPLNSQMLIDEFRLWLNGRSLQSQILPLEKAQKQYDEAVIRGDSAVYVQQHRANVFTLNIGNLAPKDDLIVQIRLLQLLAIEGRNIRIILPTVIGPRYIPGHPLGERDGFGWADPTDQVPDADWIMPPVSADGVPYSVNVQVDVKNNLPVESITSPSHQIHFSLTDEGFRVTSNANSMADRDFVLNLNLKHLPTNKFWQTRFEDRQIALGWLGIGQREVQERVPTNYFFLIDRSGSMADFKLETVKRAVRLCFRKLTTEDRFNLALFNHQFAFWQNQWENVSEQNINQAEAWLKNIRANGGTELLPALRKFFSMKTEPERKVVLILLTDGEVGNEAEIADLFEEAPQNLTVLLFGIDTAVNQDLFESIIEKSRGMVEYIYPGEPMEPKIMLQFERLGLPAIKRVEVNGKTAAIYPDSNFLLHPEDLRPVILELNEKNEKAVLPVSLQFSDEKAFRLNAEVMSCNEEMARVLKKFYASFLTKKEQSKLNDLPIKMNKRNEKRLKEKILNLALKYQLQTTLTAWFVVAKRQQKMEGLPDLQVVPVALPHTWQLNIHESNTMSIKSFNKLKALVDYYVGDLFDLPEISAGNFLKETFKRKRGSKTLEKTLASSFQNFDKLSQELFLTQGIDDGAIQPDGLENETPTRATILTLLALVNEIDHNESDAKVYRSNFLRAMEYILDHADELSTFDKIILKYVVEKLKHSAVHFNIELIAKIDKMVEKVTENSDRLFNKLNKIHLKENSTEGWQAFRKMVNSAVNTLVIL